METALLLITLAGAFGSAWLAQRELDPWVKRLGEKGGPPYRRAEWIRRYGASAWLGAVARLNQLSFRSQGRNLRSRPQLVACVTQNEK
jgi:hypothetical protein